MNQRSSSNQNDNDTEHLCFDPAVFVTETFSIDYFLRSHRNKATLEVLRNDLGTYLKELRLSMIELINKDYEDFVNLSKDLVGLNSGIEALQNPLENVKAEINLVRVSLRDAIAGMTHCMQQRAAVKRKKQSLFHLSQVILSLKKLKKILYEERKLMASDSLEFIERASSEYTVLQFSVSKCSEIMSASLTADYDAIGKTLMGLLNNSLMSGICEQDSHHLHRCLRMFASLDKVQAAEKLVQEEVVAPFLYDLINESSLKKQEEGLKGLYGKVVEFMNSQLQVLLLISDDHGFNFLINSLWVELSKRLELHTGSIFSAGDPEVFHSRYTETTKFLDILRQRCGSPTTVARFNSHPLTIHFLKKWNLLVYYKIRFQEIAGQFEWTLSEEMEQAWDGSVYQLKIPAVANMCLQRCWDEHIFIPQLTTLFWQLSLQVSARYCTWITEKVGKVHVDAVGDSQSSRLLDLQQLISLHSDTVRLSSEVDTLLQTAIDQFSSPTSRPVMASCLADTSVLFKSAFSTISDSIVEIVVRRSVLPLSNVKDIPRLFRRTNRDSPTKPCDYVNQILEPFISFHESIKSKVNEDVLAVWISKVFNQVTGLYFASVSEVLDNAQKTEESLRRLKKAKDKFASNVEYKGPTDDDKIRQQLVVDVHFYENQVNSLSLGEESRVILKELIDLVEKARVRSEKQ